MAFFGRSIASRKININSDSVSSDDPEILKRLDRIENNFSKLDVIFSDLETRFELDERLAADERVDTELTSKVKKKPR